MELEMKKYEIESLVEKSMEAFLLAIEIYNKPTIKYRLEGCLYFITNAWELLLKGKLLNDGKSIYYKDSNQTYSLSKCIDAILTNSKDPVRQNLEIIIKFRNISTHLFIPEYNLVMGKFLTACARNYSDKLFEYFSKNINEVIDNDYMTLFVCQKNQKIDILNTYGKEIFDKFNETVNFTNNLLSAEGANNKLAIGVEITLRRVKTEKDADFTYFTTNNSNATPVAFIKELQDPKNKYIYTCAKLIERVNTELAKSNIHIVPVSEKAQSKFNSNSFTLYCKEYRIKDNKKYAYSMQLTQSTAYWYSEALVVKIISDITENPAIFKEINDKNKKS